MVYINGSSKNIQDLADELVINGNLGSIKKTLELYAETVDCVTDASDVLEELEKAIGNAKLKQYEMELISYIAFHSNEPHIVELRKNLFMVIKMGYSSEINGALDVLKDRLKERDFEYNSHVAVPCSDSIRKNGISNVMKRYTHDFIDNWYNWFKRQIKIGHEVRKVSKK